jgi:hypothetical protein
MVIGICFCFQTFYSLVDELYAARSLFFDLKEPGFFDLLGLGSFDLAEPDF